MSLVPRPLPTHLSFSQLGSFTHCGEAYRLTKRFGVAETPAWALLGGSAVHHLTELLDIADHGRDVKVPTFPEQLQKEIDEQVRRTGLTEDCYRASGRSSKQWPNKEDKGWWLANGPAMVSRWQSFVRSVPWDIAELPDVNGELAPAVEVELDIKVAGTTIKAFVDRVFQHRQTGELITLDLKSGANDPPSANQLGLYKVGLEQAFGRPIRWGYFWSARSGVTSQPYDLSEFTHERVEWEYETFRFARDRGLYLANPGQACSYCQVKDYCYVQYGPLADTIPRPWDEFSPDLEGGVAP